mmetsp:Transcript_24623/g.65705  ORF Transcript_24623/g.65705 Transcript_24623/m.65705 type:complete len:226 (-) Transcript_24623:309-986(-)
MALRTSSVTLQMSHVNDMSKLSARVISFIKFESLRFSAQCSHSAMLGPKRNLIPSSCIMLRSKSSSPFADAFRDRAVGNCSECQCRRSKSKIMRGSVELSWSAGNRMHGRTTSISQFITLSNLVRSIHVLSMFFVEDLFEDKSGFNGKRSLLGTIQKLYTPKTTCFQLYTRFSPFKTTVILPPSMSSLVSGSVSQYHFSSFWPSMTSLQRAMLFRPAMSTCLLSI